MKAKAGATALQPTVTVLRWAVDRFKIGDYVRVKASRFIQTRSIASGKDVQGRYRVKYDQTNDASIFEEGLSYEDELEFCDPLRKV